ncbi:2-succinyl-6-hydroxy-2,4-cyclohexadiene-1-carboxylate synthase [Bacillus sp. Marseille-Q3570]|uniref:2-succinyl-6-hydroxy-2, 4-cyclohexadiene-1-carboxylate synthase n=1 Tax=Bacillus sp. Marseille-Q3570 TaxID=2963522 RepID=UPI0021B755E9|nr:2-succinyl-6-hydroxy-2,4-cyclohexadiene-1-carboxylate synthase [Bacillus sp. Marseille-Q3570]
MKIDVNGIQYYVETAGEGEPLLLLHGFTGSAEDWRPFKKDWEDAFKLIMVDLIGHGKTDHPEEVERYSMEETAGALNQVLADLKIESAYVLGYSLGGRVALSFAMMYPDRVKHLVLESSSPGLQTTEERIARKHNDDRLANRIEVDGIRAFVDFWEAIPLFNTQKDLLSESKRKDLREKRLHNSEVGLANSLRGMGTGVQPSWWDRLSDLTIPTTLIVGTLDQKFYRMAEDMIEKLPNGKMVVVEKAGHTIHLEQPAQFAKIVEDELHNRKDV